MVNIKKACLGQPLLYLLPAVNGIFFHSPLLAIFYDEYCQELIHWKDLDLESFCGLLLYLAACNLQLLKLINPFTFLLDSMQGKILVDHLCFFLYS
jgi:hypothetical protein